MSVTVIVERTMKVEADRAFAAISEIEHFPEHNDEVVNIEFLTAQRSGVGTRFRETRRMGSRELVTELEVVEYEAVAGRGGVVRMVADTHGTVWDTRMSARPEGAEVKVRFEMEARGSTWFKRTMNRLMQGFFRKGMAKHLDALGARLEAG